MEEVTTVLWRMPGRDAKHTWGCDSLYTKCSYTCSRKGAYSLYRTLAQGLYPLSDVRAGSTVHGEQPETGLRGEADVAGGSG